MKQTLNEIDTTMSSNASKMKAIHSVLGNIDDNLSKIHGSLTMEISRVTSELGDVRRELLTVNGNPDGIQDNFSGSERP